MLRQGEVGEKHCFSRCGVEGMPYRRSPLMLLLAGVIAHGTTGCALHRQEPVSALSPGAVVRVTRVCPPARRHETCPRYQGTFVSIDRDTLKLRSSQDSLLHTLAAGEVSRLERRSGTQKLVLPGILFGFNAGFLVGLIATSSECSDNTGSLPCVGSGAPYGMLIGALAGGVVGALVHPDKWSRVAWPPPR